MALAALSALFLGILMATAGVLFELNRVRSDLVSARQVLARAIDSPAALRTEQGRAATLAEVNGAVGSVASARRRADRSPLLKPLRFVPVVRGQWNGMRAVIDDSATATRSGRELMTRVNDLARTSRLSGGQVPLQPLEELGPHVRSTAATIGGLVRPGSRLWGPLGDARRRLDEVASDTSSRLEGAAEALDAARSFLGQGGNRRYLVAIQNNAEMRDQGMVLSYAVARFEGGRLAFEGSGPIQELTLDRPAPTPIPAETEQVFGSLAQTRIWQSVNATADFPWSARAMVDMYRQATGQSVDGVIAIDVPGLVGLLRVIGAVRVPGIPQPISAVNAPQVLLRDLYNGLPPAVDRTERRERLGEVTEAVIDRLTTGTFDPVALGRELGDGARGGHVRLWSAAAPEEEVFERTGLGGGPAAVDADRTFHVAVENRTATKLDYYVKPSVRQEVQLTPEGTAIVDTIVTVDNQAPGQPPSYQLGPDGNTKDPGDYIAWVLLWGARGSQQPGAVTESGLELSQQITTIKAGQKREFGFRTIVPRAVRDGRLELRLVPQARLTPIDLEIHLRASGWDVGGDTTWRGPWDRVRTFTWAVSR